MKRIKSMCEDSQHTCQDTNLANKRRALASNSGSIFLTLLEIMKSFFTVQEMNVLNQASRAWKKKITIDTKKHSPINRPCSLLIASCVQNALYNSEANPMTSVRFLRIAEIECLFQLTISPLSYIHHFQWISNDYHLCHALQGIIKNTSGGNWEGKRRYLNQISFTQLDLPYIKHAVDTQVKGNGLTQLNTFTALRGLKLGVGSLYDRNVNDWRFFITNVDLAQLTCLAGTLESLNIQSWHVTDRGLQVLTQLTVLKNLSLHAHITDEGLKILSNLTSLQCLSFDYCTITGVGLNALNQLTALQTLIFVGCYEITVANVAQLAQLPSLQNLSFVECWTGRENIECWIGRKNIESLADFTSLKSLNIECDDPKDVSVSPIHKLTQLHSLCLPWSKESRFTQLSGLTALRTLTLRVFDLLTPKEVEKLIDQYPNLQNLNFSKIRWSRRSNKTWRVQSKRLITALKLKIAHRRLHVTIEDEDKKVHEDVILNAS